MNLGQYKDIFGKPGEGAHSYRIPPGLGAVDVIGTIAIAGIISNYGKQSFIWVLLFLLVLATFLHWFFCVDTAGLNILKLGTACSYDSNR
jgi:hypothetical protein